MTKDFSADRSMALNKTTTVAQWQSDFSAIFASGLFDHDWYSARYPDVADFGLRPLEHYVKYGARLGRSPSRALSFPPSETDNYLEEDFTNPLVAMIRSGAVAKGIGKKGKQHRHLPPPKVSVLCITYNQAAFIRQTLDGIIAQETDFNFEVLVADDCSVDGTGAIVLEYASKYSNVVAIVRQQNLGANANFIDLASRVRGEYVAICEGDDYWTDPSKLRRQVDFLDSHPEFTVCFHPVAVLFDGSPDTEGVHPESCSAEPSIEELTDTNLIQTNSVVYRWRFRCGTPFTFDTNIAPGDWYIQLLHVEIGRVGYIDRVMAVYRKHPNGIWGGYRTALARHKKLGTNEIRFYLQAAQLFGGRFIKKFEDAARLIFRRLTEAYLLEDDIPALLELCRGNPDVVDTVMTDLGFALDAGALDGADELRESLREQSSVSVIVMCYNHGSYIRRCLDSILMQRGCFRLEVVIGDDFSTDGTEAIVEEYRAKMPHCIRVVKRDKNVGMPQNMRECIAECTGSFIAFCEGDDYWLSSTKLAKHLAFLRADPSLSMCFNWVLLYIAEEDTFIPHVGQGLLLTGPVPFAHLVKEPVTANFSCCFYRADAVRRVPVSYFDSGRAADWLFNLHVAHRGSIGFMKELLSVYNVHPCGQWSGLSNEAKKAKIIQYRREFAAQFERGRDTGMIEVEYRVRQIGMGVPATAAIVNLDQPVDGRSVIGDGQLTVAGWVLAPIRTGVFVVAETATRADRFCLNVSRLDVIKAILTKAAVPHDDAICGFRFALPYDENMCVVLSLEVAGRLHPWLEISVSESGLRSGQGNADVE